jgi:hypothetical protein
MTNDSSAEIPATTKFKSRLMPIQEEYKTALETGVHPDKEMYSKAERLNLYFYKDVCQVVYDAKVLSLIRNIIDEHNNSNLNYIDILGYQPFKDLVWEARITFLVSS